LSQKNTERWVEELAKIGVPCGPVNTIDKVVEDPQIRAREMIVDLSTQFAGKVQIPGIPVKLSQTPGQVDEPAPMLGQHTEEVLANLLGIPKTEIHNLQKLGII
jgi:CoA:oxalate CoA-transferase